MNEKYCEPQVCWYLIELERGFAQSSNSGSTEEVGDDGSHGWD